MSTFVTLEAYLAAVIVASAVMLAFAAWLYPSAERMAARLVVYWAASQAAVGLFVIGQVLAPPGALARNFFLAGTAIGSLSPILLLLFTLAYTGRTRWLSNRVLAVVGGWYALLAGLVLTDPVLGLAYTEYVLVEQPFVHTFGMPTTIFMVLSAPLWLLSLVPPILLGSRAMADTGVTRAQTLTLTAAFSLPIVMMGVWMGGVLPGPANGVFVVGAVPIALAVSLAVRRYHLFDLVPLAREMVYDELNDAVLVVDRDLRLLDYNRAAVDQFPELDGAAGVAVDALLPLTDDGNESADPFATSFRSYRDEEPRTFDVTVSRLPNEEQFQGYGLILRDVTEERRRMRDLEQQTTQLERFASTLSHDIRNPLHVAQGHLELARQDSDDPSLEKASDAVERIEQIVDDLLTLSREGRTIDEREFVPLATVVESAWETTRTRDARLELQFDADLGVYADETRLRNVFENLFRNAIEFGGDDVRVTVGEHQAGFYVEDDGPGIPEERRETVFEYEFTTAEEGTGLGLAIVESIANAHGWSVSVTDGADGGARFVFSGVDLVADPEPAEAGGSDAAPMQPTQN